MNSCYSSGAELGMMLPTIDALLTQGGYKILDNWITNKNAPEYQYPDSEVLVEYIELEIVDLDTAIPKMKAMGYRPAEDLETIRHDMRCPDQLVQGHPVVILGSNWQGRNNGRGVLILQRDGSERYVSLDWYGENGWRPVYRFAVVKLP